MAGELVKVDEAVTRDGRSSHGWKVGFRRTCGCVTLVSRVLASGFTVSRAQGDS